MPAEPHEHERSSPSTAAVPKVHQSPDDWDAVEQFFDQLFGELEAVRDEVQRKVYELQTTQARLAEREQQLQARTDEMEQLRGSLSRQQQHLAAAVAELAQLRSDLTSLGRDTACDKV